MYSVLNCHNEAEHTELQFNMNFNDNAGCFKKKVYSGISNGTVWGVLQKRLHLKA
jgi:hypothetical protein